MSEQQDTEVQSGTADSAQSKKKKRVRLLSPKKQLQVTIQRMEKRLQSDTLKESKAVDLLLAMGDLQKLLLKLTTDEERAALEEENKNLKEKIEELTAVAKPKSDDVSDFLAQLNAGRCAELPRKELAELCDFSGVVENARRQSAPTNPVHTPAPCTPAQTVTPAKVRSRESLQEELEERERQENADRQAVADLQWKQAMNLNGGI